MIKKIINNIFRVLGYQLIKIKVVSTNKNIQLTKANISNTKLITTRETLLTLLPKNGIVAELGVDTGDYSAQILKNNKPKKLYLIDTWESKRYNETKFLNVKAKFKKEIKSGHVQIIRQRSEIGLKSFKNETFDWLYIDTSHTYEQTRLELSIASKKVTKNGYIVGHDYTPGNITSCLRYGVIKAVNEFCVKKKWRIVYITMDANTPSSFCIQKI